MKWIRLAELQRISGLGDRATMHLLRQNLLSCRIDAEQGILVDVDAVTSRVVLEAVANGPLLSKEEVDGWTERLARVLAECLDGIVKEAVEEFRRTPSETEPG